MNRLLTISLFLLACFAVMGQEPYSESSTSVKDTVFSIEISSYGTVKTYQKWIINQDSAFFFEWNGSIYTSQLQPQIAYSISSSEKSKLYKLTQYLIEKVDGRRKIEINRRYDGDYRNTLKINHPISRSTIKISITGEFTPFSLLADCVNSMTKKRDLYLRGRLVRFQLPKGINGK